MGWGKTGDILCLMVETKFMEVGGWEEMFLFLLKEFRIF